MRGARRGRPTTGDAGPDVGQRAGAAGHPWGAVGGRRELLLSGGGVVGFLFGLFAFLTIEASVGGAWLRTGPDLDAYLRAGHDLLAGAPVYVGRIGDPTNFPYAPTWALIAAALALLPPLAVQAGIIVLDLAAMRYVAGSWRGVGWILLWPLTAFELSAGNIDLLIAAAVVLAWSPGCVRGRGRELGRFGELGGRFGGLSGRFGGLGGRFGELGGRFGGLSGRIGGLGGRIGGLVLVSLAKLAPVLALPPARWRHALVALLVCVAVTLPVLHLWPDWFAYLLRQPATIAISLPVGPWYLRLPVALGLAGLGTFVLRRPWLSALAVIVAMPSLYLSTSVILIAPIRLWLDARHAAPQGMPASDVSLAPEARNGRGHTVPGS